jgi:hypothetical protein
MLTENNLSKHTLRVGNVNPMVSNYTSPISQSLFCSFLLLLLKPASCRYYILSERWPCTIVIYSSIGHHSCHILYDLSHL